MSFLCKTIIFSILFLILAINNTQAQMAELKLPEPILSEGKQLRQDIQERYSNRSFEDKKALSIEQLSTILWATYGKKIKNVDAITSATYTIPSAGGIYALEIFVVVGRRASEEIKEGVYHYIKEDHKLRMLSSADKRGELASACLRQRFIEDAPMSIVITANPNRMIQRYGERAERYVILEAGHAAQNLCLIANDLGLTTVEIGAFIDKGVAKVLNTTYAVLLVIPIGYEK